MLLVLGTGSTLRPSISVPAALPGRDLCAAPLLAPGHGEHCLHRNNAGEPSVVTMCGRLTGC